MTDERLSAELADVREFSRLFSSANPDEAVEAFRSLLDRILRLTVMQHHSFVRTIRHRHPDARRSLGGPDGIADPIPLNDGRYLRLMINLNRSEDRLSVAESSFQYQADASGKQWLFRYDFVRRSLTGKPEAHLHVNGDLRISCLPHQRWTLKDVHFPTVKRISLESLIRLLADDFQIVCNEDEALWRAVLHESETGGFFR